MPYRLAVLSTVSRGASAAGGSTPVMCSELPNATAFLYSRGTGGFPLPHQQFSAAGMQLHKSRRAWLPSSRLDLLFSPRPAVCHQRPAQPSIWTQWYVPSSPRSQFSHQANPFIQGKRKKSSRKPQGPKKVRFHLRKSPVRLTFSQ